MNTEMHNPQNHEDESFDRPGFWGPPIRTQVCDWLRANGINPRHVRKDARATLVDDQITLVMKVQNEAGNDIVDPDGLDVLKETRTFPVVVPPPPLIETWLAAKCPTCGR